MEKRYADATIFYRSWSPWYSVCFTGSLQNLTVLPEKLIYLSCIHYFLLGMFFFLILMPLKRISGFPAGEKIGIILTVYHIGLNVTAPRFSFKGLTQVWGTELSRGMDASISGLSGVGHIMLGISMILLLLKIKKKTVLEKSNAKKRKRPVNADGTAVYRICPSCIYRPFLMPCYRRQQLFIAQQQADDTAEDSCDRINDGRGPEHIK